MSRPDAPLPETQRSPAPRSVSSRFWSRVMLLLALTVTLAIAQLGVSHPANAEARILPVAGDHYVPENSYRPIDGSFTSLKPLAPSLDTRSTTRSEDGDEPLATLPAEPAYPPCFDVAGQPARPEGIAVHPALFVPFFACAPPART